MPAPKKNTFWRQRRKHGRDLSATSEFFQETSDDYFQWLLDNPIIVPDKRLVNGKLRTIYHERIHMPTLGGYLSYIQMSPQTWNNFLNREGFFDALSAIQQQIEHYQLAYAAVDVFNEKVVSGVQGLSEKTEQEVTFITHESLLKNGSAYQKTEK